MHLSGRQAGEHAAAAGVGRLLLTHVPAWFAGDELLAEAKEAFDGPVELVTPDGVYEVGVPKLAGWPEQTDDKTTSCAR